MLVYAREKIQEVQGKLLFHALISKDFRMEKQTYFVLFFVNRNAAALVQGPDLGMELTFPQERQSCHTAPPVWSSAV